jgi:flagellar basal body-associated protein FliL
MQPNNPGSDQPTEDQPQNGSSMNRTIQPLSSEDDIRKAVEATRIVPPTSNQTVNQTDVTTPANSLEPTNTYEPSTLITEPLHRPPQATQPQFHVTSPQSPPQNKKGGKAIYIVVGLIIVAALAIGAYFFLFSNKIGVSDLVQETVQQTTYLRPKQWHPVGADVGGWGDLKAENGKSSASVLVKESQQASPLAGASDAIYEQLRTQLVNQAPAAAVEAALKNSSEVCKTDMAFKAETDTKKTKTAIGLITMIGSCTRKDGEFTLKIHIVAGISDGQIRVIALGARNVDWDKNSEAFQAILDSVGQANI